MNTKIYNVFKIVCLLLASSVLTGCKDVIDDAFSRHHYTLDMTSSTHEIVLEENKADEIALVLAWKPASDLGPEYSTSYIYEIENVGNATKGAVKEYVAQDEDSKSYTHKELQNMLVDYWERPTGATTHLQITITANTEGPRIVIPEVATVRIKVSTYGAKPFLADKLFMRGTAVSGGEMEISRASGSSTVYVYTGDLSAGTINFPVIFGEDTKVNAIGPLEDNQEILNQAMDAQVLEVGSSGTWQITQADRYRVTVDMSSKQVSIIPAGDILDIDGLFLAGTAVGTEVQVARTLEDDKCFAFRGHLNAGTLYLPVLFDNQKAISLVPDLVGSQPINDGVLSSFSQSQSGIAQNSNHWMISTPGVYRIVINVETKDITIYSPSTDLQSKSVTWNNTVLPQNPYTSPITELWMYGGFNEWKGDGNGFQGFHNNFKLVQSLANPNILVYRGATLPRSVHADEFTRESYTGALRFAVSNIHNNVYAFGSTASAQRNIKNGYTVVSGNGAQTLVEGQGDNRYAYFCIPPNTNFVMVDVKNLTVVFDTK